MAPKDTATRRKRQLNEIVSDLSDKRFKPASTVTGDQNKMAQADMDDVSVHGAQSADFMSGCNPDLKVDL
jgi:hypothetical protein